MKKPIIPKTKPARPKRINPLALRRELKLSQSAFWHPLGVTQSGGSRYESGRRVLPSVAMLLELVYLKGFDLKQVEAHDMRIIRYLKQNQPDLYATLTRAVEGAADFAA